jgi:protein-L-isoaspartate O-methyltransferase
LLAQLKTGGRAVAPVGPLDGIQDLLLIEKTSDGSAVTRRLFPVRFVPSTGAP